MKPLPKSMREDHRYVSMKLHREINQEKASKIIEKAVKSYAGDRGLVRISPEIIDSESDYENSKIVVRINRDFEQMFRAATVLSEEKIVTLNVSGSSASF